MPNVRLDVWEQAARRSGQLTGFVYGFVTGALVIAVLAVVTLGGVYP